MKEQVQQTVFFVLSLPLLLHVSVNEEQENSSAEDQAVCQQIFTRASGQNLSEQPLDKIVVWVGKRFLGTPYEAHTLEQPGDERLVVYLRGFDCVTFVENVLALSRCVKQQRGDFQAYADELRNIRYREGNINGYPSRLHYFSEWIEDNQHKGTLRNVTSELGGESYKKTLDWMTKHRGAYHQMQDGKVFRRIGELEQTLSKRELWYIPKTKISQIETGILDGDIIAMVSRRDGLDVEHVGIAVGLPDGRLHYMHAPTRKGKVTISAERLVTYITKHESYLGIMVARPTISDEPGNRSEEARSGRAD